MKIVHILFDDYPYLSSWGYQENKMAEIQVQNGDQVTIISGLYVPTVLKGYIKEEELGPTEGTDMYGVKIIRLRIGNKKFEFINRKIKRFKGLYNELVAEAPDILFVHDIHAVGIFDVKKYIKDHKGCRCFADIHVNYTNSGKNFISRYILHRIFYRTIISLNKNIFESIYYLNEDSRRFARKEYGIKNNLEFLPLGGTMIDLSYKEIKKKEYRISNKLPGNTTIFLHSGKLNQSKKSLELIKAFSKIHNDHFLLIIIGKISEEIKESFMEIIRDDKRIKYLGWKSAKELNEYLEIADVYLQPGTPSITAHEAMCKGCATMLNDSNGYYKSFIPEKAAMYINTDNDIYKFLNEINQNSHIVDIYKENGYQLASEIFDYKMQVQYLTK